jgi:CTP:molybdopterin cytidylyltransferase MocA
MMTAHPAALHVLLLAAGAARRFGSPKQLARIDGQPLLRRAVDLATAVAGQSVTVVLGAEAARIAPLLKRTTTSVVINRHWEEGLASSLREGLRALPIDCEGVLILLADQAAVSVADLERLIAAWRRQPESLVSATYDGHIGAPSIFPRWTFAEVDALHGDVGARQLLLRHADRLLTIQMASAAVDVDTPEDLGAVAGELLHQVD